MGKQPICTVKGRTISLGQVRFRSKEVHSKEARETPMAKARNIQTETRDAVCSKEQTCTMDGQRRHRPIVLGTVWSLQLTCVFSTIYKHTILTELSINVCSGK